MSLPFDEIGPMLQKLPCSSGFSLNVVDVSRPSEGARVSNFEVSPTKINGYGYHFNL